MGDPVGTGLLGLTAQIVVAHISHNQVAADALPDMIQSIYHSLASAGTPGSTPTTALVPAVPAKMSVFPDFLICLEDGKKLKMLKRYLKTRFGMTTADYREKWSLPPDYPMVAPNYTRTRSRLALSAGLGRKSSPQADEPEASEPSQPSEPVVTKVKARRARGTKG